MKSTKSKAYVSLLGLFMLLFTVFFVAVTSCSDDNKVKEYDPNLPVTISEIYPETGGYFETVILRGENFGNDHKKIRVFFNQKEAITVGASGDRVLVHVPKLPGDDCKIKMLIGDNTTDTIFADKHFAYVKDYQLQYVAGQAGSNTDWFSEGSLQETTFGNAINYLACDPRGIIYLNHKNNGCRGSLVYINEPEHYTKFLICGEEDNGAYKPCGPYYDEVTDIVYYMGQGAAGYFWEVDPNDSWSVAKRKLVAPNEEYKKKGYHGFTTVGSDIGLRWGNSLVRVGEYFYCRTYEGCLFRFKPTDRVYDIVAERTVFNKNNGSADNHLAVDPDDPTKIYCSLQQLHRITLIDTTKDPNDPDFETVVCGLPGVGGFQEGHYSVARMNTPEQFVVMKDPETGNKVLYICDRFNQCVRKFDTVTKMMTTVAGTPGKWGYELGNPTVSKMDQPIGICISPENDIYISTAINRVILKLAFL